MLAYRQDTHKARVPTTLAGNARAAIHKGLDADRWINERGSHGAEATALPPPL